MRDKRIVTAFLFGMFAASLLIGCKGTAGKSINSVTISSFNAGAVTINFESGEVSGEIPEIVKPKKSDLDEFQGYINENWGEIKDRDYMSEASKTEDNGLIWQIGVTYSSGKNEKTYGDEAFPKEWKEIVTKANKLIGEDFFNGDTGKIPLK